MRTPPRTTLLLLGGLLVAACGGGGDSDEGPTGPGIHNMTAEIDGDDWSAQGFASRGAGGLYSIIGTNASITRTVSITLYNIDSPGTYPLGVGVTMVGGTGLVSYTSGEGWATPLNGLSGSITITTLTSGRMVGTFEYTTTALSGGATGTVEVANGEFDMLVGGAPLADLPDYAGTTFSATVGGTPFVAGAAALAAGSGNLVMNAGNTTELISLTLSSVADTGTFALSSSVPFRNIAFNGDVSSVSAPIWGSQVTDVGSVHITRFDAARVTGTFTATLHPATAAATGALVLSGSFSYGRTQIP